MPDARVHREGLNRLVPDVLRDRVMTPLGASDRWSWHGYPRSTVTIDGREVPADEPLAVTPPALLATIN